ncbi:MAG: KOW domain-containing RNA-binding protein [Eubacteriales bacterium]|nr:KOW domain-containing RNA-binding protein [Eubacteriales bacterium]
MSSGAYWLGALVRSEAGHDTGRIYLVIGYDLNEYTQRLYLVDGKYRKYLEPKAKNPKQLTFLEQVLDDRGFQDLLEEDLESGARDREVRRLIKSYKKENA